MIGFYPIYGTLLRKLREKGVLKRVGKTSAGYWKISF